MYRCRPSQTEILDYESLFEEGFSVAVAMLFAVSDSEAAHRLQCVAVFKFKSSSPPVQLHKVGLGICSVGNARIGRSVIDEEELNKEASGTE